MRKATVDQLENWVNRLQALEAGPVCGQLLLGSLETFTFKQPKDAATFFPFNGVQNVSVLRYISGKKEHEGNQEGVQVRFISMGNSWSK